MKTNLILPICILLFTATVSAQYNGYNNNSRYGRYGTMVDHGVPTKSPAKLSPEDIEKDRNEKIEKVVSKLKEDLTLDELQVIAIRNEIISSSKNMDILMKSETTDEDKLNKFKESQEKLDKTIISYLSSIQKEKFQKLKEDKATNKDKKKKNKDQIPE
jgi:hypothetical protein